MEACGFVRAMALCMAALASSCAPSNTPASKPGTMTASMEKAVASYSRAAGAYDAGNFEAAADGASLALDAEDSFLPAIVLLGKASYFSGDDETAIMALEKGLAVSPRSGEAALWLARAYLAARRDEDARSMCELLLSAEPSNVAALRLSAGIALDSGDGAAALAFLDRAIAATGDAGLAFTDRAAMRWAAGDLDGTVADLGAALAILPEESVARKAVVDLLASIQGTQR